MSWLVESFTSTVSAAVGYATGNTTTGSATANYNNTSANLNNNNNSTGINPMLRGRIPTDFVVSDTTSQNTAFFPMRLSPFLVTHYRRTGGATSYTLIHCGVSDAVKLLDLVSVEAGSQQHHASSQFQYLPVSQQQRQQNTNNNNNNNSNNNNTVNDIDGFDEITGDEASRLTSEFQASTNHHGNNNNGGGASHNMNNGGSEFVDSSTLKMKLRDEFAAADDLFRDPMRKGRAAGIVRTLERVAGLAYLFQMSDFSDAYAIVFAERIIKVITVKNLLPLPRNNTFASTNDLTSMSPSKYNTNNNNHTQNNLASSTNNNNTSRNQQQQFNLPPLYELLLQANKVGVDTSSAAASLPLTEERLRKAATAARAALFTAVTLHEPTEPQRKILDDEWTATYKPLFPINSAQCASIALYQSVGDTLGNETQHPLARLSWEADDNVTACRRCGQAFTLVTVRRSHCRSCGRIFCKNCLDPAANNKTNLVASEDCYFSTHNTGGNGGSSSTVDGNSAALNSTASTSVHHHHHSAHLNDIGFDGFDDEVEYDVDGFVQQQQTRQQFAIACSSLMSKQYEKACLECANNFGEGRRVRFLQDLIERCGFSIVVVHIVSLIDSDWKTAATRVLRLYKESIYTGKPDARHDRMVLASASDAAKHPQLLLRLAKLTSPNYAAQRIDHQQAQFQYERDNPRHFRNNNNNANGNNNNNNNNNSTHRRKKKLIVPLPQIPFTSQLWDLSHPDYDPYRASSGSDDICAVMLNQNDEKGTQVFSHGQLACTRACGFSLADRGTFAVLVVATIAHIPSVYYQYNPVLVDAPTNNNNKNNNARAPSTVITSPSSESVARDELNNTNPSSSPSFNSSLPDIGNATNNTSTNSATSFDLDSPSSGSYNLNNSTHSNSSGSNFSTLHRNLNSAFRVITSAKNLSGILPIMVNSNNAQPTITNQQSARRLAGGTKMVVYTESRIVNYPILEIRQKAQLALVGFAPTSDYTARQLLDNLPSTVMAGTSRNFNISAISTPAAGLYDASPTPRADNYNNNNNHGSLAVDMHNNNNNNNSMTNNTVTTSEIPLVARTESSKLSVWLYALTDLLTDSTSPGATSSSSHQQHHLDKNSADCIKSIIQRTILGKRGLMLKTYNEFHSRCTFVGRWNRSQFEEIIKSISDDDLRAQFQHLDVLYEVLNDVARKKPKNTEEARACIENALPRSGGGGGGSGSGGGGGGGLGGMGGGGGRDPHNLHRAFNTTITNFGGAPIEIGPTLDKLENAANLHPHSKRIIIKENQLKIIDLLDEEDPQTISYLRQEEVRTKNWRASQSNNNADANNNNNINQQEPPPNYRPRHQFIPIHPVLYPFDHDAKKFIIAIDIANVKTLSSNSKPIYIPLVCQEIVPSLNNNNNNNNNNQQHQPQIKLEYRPILLKMENVWRDHVAREFAFILYDLMTAKPHHSASSSSSSRDNNNNNNGGDILMSCLKQDMYSALPLSEDCGIVEWLDDEAVVPLEKILKGGGNNSNNNNNSTSTPAAGTAVASIAPTTSYSVLRQYLLQESRDPLDTRRQVFCRSVQFSILLCHILGVSDRHLSNVMINTRTLAIVDIDFGFMFGSRTLTEHFDLLGKKLLQSLYYSPSGPIHKIHGITTARFDPILAEAVTEVRYQQTQAQRELRRRRQEQQQQQDGNNNNNNNNNGEQPPPQQQPRRSHVTITRLGNDNNIEPGATGRNETSSSSAVVVPGSSPLTPEELQKQEYEKIMKQREAALDDFISETAKLLFVKIRPHMDIILLLFTKSSRYLDDLGQANTNQQRHATAQSSSSGNGARGGDASGAGAAALRNTNDETIAEHFFHCFALTKTDSDAQDCFRKELKEVRSRYFQDLIHTANQLGPMGMLNAGIESVKSFFGGSGEARR